MAQFIQVSGPDPDYNGAYRSMLLNVAHIVRIVPLFVEHTEAGNWLCTEDYPKASILAYRLIDIHKNEFYIGPALLEKLGAAFDLPIPNVTDYKEGNWKNMKKRPED